MKKWNVIFWVFFGLFLIIGGYLDFYVKLDSIYWLVCKLVGFALLILGQLLLIILKKEESKALVVFRICFCIFFIGYFGHSEITRYKSDICDDKFGREFNARRRKLGTPEIPADWNVDYKGRRSVDWKAKDTAGHAVKYISIDSSCTIRSEEDFYNLKPIHGVSRDVSVFTRYAKGKGSDSISYFYEAGFNTNRQISRQQADSIFAAEKINKDY
jgi:hypothetical protein